MNLIHVSTRVHGFHCWPDAPFHRKYLSERHMHEFRIGVSIEVSDPNRETEFHDARERLEAIISTWSRMQNANAVDFGDLSCEQIGQAILSAYPETKYAFVYEDELHGATVSREKMLSSPELTTVCGSTKFKEETEKALLELEGRGIAALSVGGFMHADKLSFTHNQKAAFDRLHKDKIRMSDSIYVVNPEGYIGKSTSSEIRLAWKLGIPVMWRYGQFAVDPEPLNWFADQMAIKLLKHAKKGGRSVWSRYSLPEALRLIRDEVEELAIEVEPALTKASPTSEAERLLRVISEASDIANYAMITADIARTLLEGCNAQHQAI